MTSSTISHHYTFIDHTADLGVIIFGGSLQQLFENAAGVLYDLIFLPKAGNGCAERHTVAFDITGDDWADLMINWLRELLYLWAGKQMVVLSVTIKVLSAYELSANITCGGYSPAVYDIKHDIKAVTYHQSRVEKKERGWAAQVIFDV